MKHGTPILEVRADQTIIAKRWCETCNKWIQIRDNGILAVMVCPECHSPWDKDCTVEDTPEARGAA